VTNPEVALLIVSILTGFPIAFTLMGMGVLFGFYAYYDASRAEGVAENRVFDLLVNQTWSVMSNDVLMAIPLFLFMGYIIERANLVDRLFLTLAIAGRKLPGAMALAALATCALFATATGIVGAVVTLMGLLALPVMLKARYDPSLASGVICAGGCLGILIPPSIMLIVYSATSGVPVLPLYAAALLPGLLLAGLYMIYVFVRALMNPELAPPPPPEDIPDAGPAAIARMLLTSFAPLAILIFCVLGSILWGLATPSEAASMGVIGGLLLSLFYRIDAIRSGALAPDWAGREETQADRAAFALGFSGIVMLAALALYVLLIGALKLVGAPSPDEPGLILRPGRIAGAVAFLAMAVYLQGASLPVLGGLMPARGDLRRIFVFAGQGGVIGLAAGGLYWLLFGPLDQGAAFAFHTVNPFGPEIGLLVGLAGYAAWRVLDGERFRESLVLTVRTSAMVCWLFVGSGIFASVFAYLGGVDLIKEMVVGLDLSPVMFLLLAQAIIFLLGWPLEWSEIIIIFVPIFLPLLAIFEIDPLLFGILIALNLQTSFLTPPVAMSAFYLKGVAPPELALADIFRGSMPFLFIVFFAMFLVYMFPGLALWLPEVFYGN
jgi:TRAP-type mannitol/chloroaromatic compound transport system permease large subunit